MSGTNSGIGCLMASNTEIMFRFIVGNKYKMLDSVGKNRLIVKFMSVRWLAIVSLILLGCALVSAPSYGNVPDAWHDTPYEYNASNTPLSDVLNDFAETFGVTLRVSGNLSQRVNGNFQADNAIDVLNRITSQYKLQWYVYNNVLYISPLSDAASARIKVSSQAMSDFRQAMTDIGLYDHNFGWGELPDDNVVLVTGPRSYIAQVQHFASQSNTTDDSSPDDANRRIMVFPLHYAQAGDRQISYRRQTLTIPGMASILNALLNPDENRPIQYSNLTDTGNSSGMTTIPASNTLNSMRNALVNEASPSDHEELDNINAQTDAIPVTADIRDNAVLIYDNPERRPFYQRVIDELDVPRDLININAVIVDIDRNQMGALSSDWQVTSGNSNMGSNMLPAGASSTVFIQNYDNFFARLRALEGQGEARIIANPSIMTLDNQAAVIDLSTTDYITATGERVANIQPVTAGTMLKVVPHVIMPNTAQVRDSHRNAIQLDVNVEDGKLQDSPINSGTPEVSDANVDTQAVIGEKRSLVIGGFQAVEDSNRRRRVHILGYIPILGNLLFSSNESTADNRVRLFILTPNIVGTQVDPSQYLPPSERWGVNHMMDEISQRQRGDVMQRNHLRKVMPEFAAGWVPQGFNSQRPTPADMNICRSTNNFDVQHQRVEYYKGEDFDIEVFAVRNMTPQRHRFSELNCFGPRTLAVSAWPHIWVDGHSQTEVFVAIRHNTPIPEGMHSRPNLLLNDTGGNIPPRNMNTGTTSGSGS